MSTKVDVPDGIRTTPLIDPRLRDRRIEVARTEGRRRLRRVVVLVLVAVLVAAAFGVTRSPLLDVDHIEVRGVDATSGAEVREALGVSLGTPLVSIDPAALARRVEVLPWVAEASVARSWPSALVVRIEERVPVAVVGSSEAQELVDADGRVLGPADGSPDLPEIEGATAAVGESLSDDQQAIAALLAALPDEIRSEIATAGAASDGIELDLADGIVVRWGDATQQTAKADALRVLLRQDDRDTFSTIDVSVPRASTVTFRSAEAE